MAEQSNTQQPDGRQPSEAAPQQQRQQRQARPCPKDCSKCGYQQHAYCSARMTFQMFEVMNGIIQRLDIQSERIADLEQHIQALQATEDELSSPLPMEGDLFPTAE